MRLNIKGSGDQQTKYFFCFGTCDHNLFILSVMQSVSPPDKSRFLFSIVTKRRYHKSIFKFMYIYAFMYIDNILFSAFDKFLCSYFSVKNIPCKQISFTFHSLKIISFMFLEEKETISKILNAKIHIYLISSYMLKSEHQYSLK